MTSASRSGSVLVVGAGIVGLTTAWQLAEQGHGVTLVDPALAADQNIPYSGSRAALGVLMGRVFQRSSGRAWRLRQRSQTLWERWLPELERRGHRLPQRRGLLLLASTPEERAKQERIAGERNRQGLPMRLLDGAELEALHPRLPGEPLGGLWSPDDGQLDPRPLLAALLQEAQRAGVVCLAARAEAVERGKRWRLGLTDGRRLEAEWLVLALGLETAGLLAAVGLELGLQPVLGQALELELAGDPGWNWPGVVVWRGINLVPRSDLDPGGRRLWLGATLEPGATASPEALEGLRQLGGDAPGWLQGATVVRRWQGLRCQPQDQPAPVLEEPEPGLLITTGHHRNGVLLAPATAAWVCDRVSGESPPDYFDSVNSASITSSPPALAEDPGAPEPLPPAAPSAPAAC